MWPLYHKFSQGGQACVNPSEPCTQDQKKGSVPLRAVTGLECGDHLYLCLAPVHGGDVITGAISTAHLAVHMSKFQQPRACCSTGF
jgi:hypothetical protein